MCRADGRVAPRLAAAPAGRGFSRTLWRKGARPMSRLYLPANASRARVRGAERARRHRADITRELSWGRVSRRDLIRWGLFTSAGLLAPIRGLNPLVRSVAAMDDGIPRSPLSGAEPFTQTMPRFDVLPRRAVTDLNPAPTAKSNQTQQPLDSRLGTGTGPIEGRPPGD